MEYVLQQTVAALLVEYDLAVLAGVLCRLCLCRAAGDKFDRVLGLQEDPH